MNILITLYYKAELGGLHDNVYATAVEAKARGHNVYVACRLGLFNDKLKDAGIKTIVIDFENIPNALNTILSRLGDSIDLIHAHPGASRILAMKIHNQCNIPVIYHVHGAWIDNINFYIDKIESVFAVSESVKKKVVNSCGGYEHKVHVIPNYSDYDYNEPKFIENSAQKKIISLITRLDNDKKLIIDEFKKLIPFLNTIESDIQLNIIGDGQLKNEFIEYLKRNIYNRHVEINLIGWIKDKVILKELIEESYIIIGPGRVAIDSYTLGRQVIVVGSQNYQGIITHDNWQTFASNNFGGYGQQDSSRDIVKDVELLLYNPNAYKTSLDIGQKVVRTFFDKEYTLEKHFNIYSIVKTKE